MAERRNTGADRPYDMGIISSPWGSELPVWSSPEKRFMVAILLDGVQSALSGDAVDQAWVLDPRMDSPTSFNRLCELCNIDPDRARRSLQSQWQSGAVPVRQNRTVGNPKSMRITEGSRYRRPFKPTMTKG